MKSNTHILDEQNFIKRYDLRAFFKDMPKQIRKKAVAFGIEPSDSRVDAVIAQLAMWQEDIDFANNTAKQCAEHIVGKTVVINFDRAMQSAAASWRFDLNVIAKNLAWLNAVSDTSKDELVGWKGYPIEKPYAVFDIVSGFDGEETKKVFEFADKKLSGYQPKAILVNAAGNSLPEQQLYIAAFGRCVAGYLAALNGVGHKL